MFLPSLFPALARVSIGEYVIVLDTITFENHTGITAYTNEALREFRYQNDKARQLAIARIQKDIDHALSNDPFPTIFGHGAGKIVTPHILRTLWGSNCDNVQKEWTSLAIAHTFRGRQKGNKPYPINLLPLATLGAALVQHCCLDVQRLQEGGLGNKEVAVTMLEVELGKVKCVVCRVRRSDDDMFRCGRCRIVVYCSCEHQKEHWQTHKQVCKRAP